MTAATRGRFKLTGRIAWWQLISIATACAVVACAGESDNVPLVYNGTGGNTSSGTGGGASSGQGGSVVVPFGDEDDVYQIPENTTNCEYDWILPACNKEAGESCYTALDCLPTCCSCPDGSVYGAGACDYPTVGADTGTCAYPAQVCGNTNAICG